jgi:hypothetical protein
MTVPDANDISRTVLLSMHDGSQPTIEAAQAAHDATGLVIVADETGCRTSRGQAALLTAVVTAVRAFGRVAVLAEIPGARVVTGLFHGSVLADVLVGQGAHLLTADDFRMVSTSWPTLLVGATSEAPASWTSLSTAPLLRVDWSGWTATVGPAAALTTALRRSEASCVLASVAAAALGVNEAFSFVKAQPGSDAGYRTVRLNLWSPGEEYDDGPTHSYAPAAWWLVGLGHLGQASSWVISWLDYADPSAVQIVLQDVDLTTPANHSTGMLTPAESSGMYKTRLVAAALDIAGFDTRILERRLDSGLHVSDADCHVALLGVDNLATRRLVSDVGWRFAVDSGLGSGRTDYSSILLRRFPGGQASHEIPAWAESDDQPVAVPDSPAFDDLSHRGDACGVVELAGKAVGASFVGAVAACFAVAETVRELHGGSGFDITMTNLDSADSTRAPATVRADVISAPVYPAT